jgi:hypothetical protein
MADEVAQYLVLFTADAALIEVLFQTRGSFVRGFSSNLAVNVLRQQVEALRARDLLLLRECEVSQQSVKPSLLHAYSSPNLDVSAERILPLPTELIEEISNVEPAFGQIRLEPTARIVQDLVDGVTG